MASSQCMDFSNELVGESPEGLSVHENIFHLSIYSKAGGWKRAQGQLI